ncbi:MAG: ATP-binding protein [Defluviitaleaceae bacterium]|nr:ATP-binding protein [Defluviitaleaceae bacterium]
MLLRFDFRNFRSFRDKTSLSMVATPYKGLDDILIYEKNHRLLPSAVIYGPNAGGKSNIILAMETLREIIVNGSVSDRKYWPMSALELFIFAHDSNTEPISFEIEFLSEDRHFIYSLSIDVDALNQGGNRSVSKEALKLALSDEVITLFDRTKYDINLGKNKDVWKMLGHDDIEQFSILQEVVVLNLDEEKPFLTAGFKSTISKHIADKVINFLDNRVNTIIDYNTFVDDTSFVTTEEPPTKNSLKSYGLFDMIMPAIDAGPQPILLKPEDKDERGIRKMVLVSGYGIDGKETIIPSHLMESEGTFKFLYFAPLLQRLLSKGGLLMIDEMDNSIHPEIVKAIIAVFGNPDVNTGKAQLIFTSHNPIFMDLDLLRPDQILFVEKNDEYKSNLYSLADFNPSSYERVSLVENYFKGRYGKLPYLDLEDILTNAMEEGKNEQENKA